MTPTKNARIIKTNPKNSIENLKPKNEKYRTLK